MFGASAVTSSGNNQGFEGGWAQNFAAARARLTTISAQRLLEQGAATRLSSASTALREQRLELLLRRADAMMRALGRLRQENPDSAEASVALAERFALSSAGAWAYRFSWREFSTGTWTQRSRAATVSGGLSLDAGTSAAATVEAAQEEDGGEDRAAARALAADPQGAAALLTGAVSGAASEAARALAGLAGEGAAGGPSTPSAAVATASLDPGGRAHAAPLGLGFGLGAGLYIGTGLGAASQGGVSVIGAGAAALRDPAAPGAGPAPAARPAGTLGAPIPLAARDAALDLRRGGGAELLTIGAVGALALRIDPGLAAGPERILFSREGDGLRLDFGGGDSLSIEGLSHARAVFANIGGAWWTLSEGPAWQGADVLV